MEQTNKTLREALFLLEKIGFNIIPIAAKSKKPLVDWKKYQKTRATREEIINWFKKWPDANIAVVTGEISGIVIVDIDPRHGGHSKDFHSILTVKSRTGGGGEHIYFKYEEGIANAAGVRPGIDIRGEGGYAIVPPSIHTSGKTYEWLISPHDKNPILSLPGFVKEWMQQQKPTRGSNLNPQILHGVEEGSRNNDAASAIGKLLVHLPTNDWESVAWQFALGLNKRNKPPLSDVELRHIFDSIAKRELERREIQKYSYSPEKSLGNVVAETNQEIVLLPWEDFMQQEETEDEKWIIPNLLRRSWLAVLGGHGKQGKTTLSVHLLNALRSGESFIDNCESVPVVYINCEMGIADVRDLLKTVSSNYSSDGKTAYIVNQPPLPLDLKVLEETLMSQEEKGVCLIDSFRAAFVLKEDFENQAGAVGGILRKLQFICRRTGWTILLIHHSRKSGTGDILDLAGSGEWSSAPDVIFTWHSPNPKEPGTLSAGGRIPPFESLAVRLSREQLDFQGTIGEQSAKVEKQNILDLLSKSDKDLSSEDIAKSLKLPAPTVRRRLTELLPQVEKTGEGRRGSPHVWRIKP